MGAGVSSVYDEFMGGLIDVYANGLKIDVIPDFAEKIDINGLKNIISRYFEAKRHVESVNSACIAGHAVAQKLLDASCWRIWRLHCSSCWKSSLPVILKGFALLGCINTKSIDNPAKSLRLLDEKRKGLAGADGGNAAILEELQHALARGAKFYGEVKGYSMIVMVFINQAYI